MSAYKEITYSSADGLQLYARDYNSSRSGPVLLMMHGLTRNSADFEALCDLLGDRYRMLVADQRGRGLSDWDPNPANYQLPVYASDMFALLDSQSVTEVVLIGTSMGGLMAMIMTSLRPEIIRAVILNDIGPEIDPQGVARIKSYVGKSMTVSNWDEAAAQCARANGPAFPELTAPQWLQLAKRTYREDDNGVPVLAYDLAISQAIEEDQESAAPADLWPLFDVMAGLPLLVIRGALSDILSQVCVDKMVARHSGVKAVSVTGVGHAPMLDELEAIKAIQDFLASLDC
ncbi:MAG: alpha/beta hydrolase [Pseudomonadales bacterium]